MESAKTTLMTPLSRPIKKLPNKRTLLSCFPSNMQPRQEQKDILVALEKIWDKSKIIVINAPVACHSPDQEVLMFDGCKKPIKHVAVGDFLMGPDSTARRVREVHSGKGPMYKIIPYRGESWTATGNHLLRVWRYVRTGGNRTRVGKFVHELITVEEYINKSKDYKNNTWMQRIGVNFLSLKNKLPIPPYILGAWLGDGTSEGTALTGMHDEITSEWMSYGKSIGLECEIYSKPNNKASTYTLTSRIRSKGSNELRNSLKELDIFGQGKKRIPHIYLTASREDRMELLAGLIDTDGYHMSNSSCYELTQVNKELALDIQFLARSLGYSASMNIKIIKGKPYYRQSISGKHINELPVRLEYKRCTNSVSNQNNYKFTVEKVGDNEDFFGVTVDNDNLYLLGDFTITHNCGKSSVALAISKFAGRANLIVPNKMLVNQYKTSFPYLQAMKGKSDYYCQTYKCSLDKRPVVKKRKTCASILGCVGCEEYLFDLKMFRVKPVILSNYHVYVAHRNYKDCLIVDEAHLLIDLIKDLNSKKFWQHNYKYPSNLRTREDIKRWVNNLKPEQLWFKHNLSKERTWLEEENQNLLKLKEELNSERPSFMVQVSEDEYRGETLPCIKMIPLDVSDCPKFLWPDGKVNKIILLSATINQQDIEQLGLGQEEVRYINAKSPIAPERRPIIVNNNLMLNMSLANQTQDVLLDLAYTISNIASEHTGEKGIVHMPYNLAEKLRTLGTWDKRFMFHDKQNKQQIFQSYKDLDADCVLIASGMYEGIDLPYDSGRWQIIAKVPWPSLADKAVKYMSEINAKWYAWEAAKTLIQASGRICRTPTDYGRTYVVDKTFNRLYSQNQELFPEWFKQAFVGDENVRD